MIGKGGVLYRTTSGGAGTVFKLRPPASPGGARTETVLHNFVYPSEGYNPLAGVIGSGGVLYGTTQYGGTGCPDPSCGTVFSLTPPAAPGDAWTEATLYSFTGGSDGLYPRGGVVISKSGVLYGATTSDGTWFAGTVYALKP